MKLDLITGSKMLHACMPTANHTESLSITGRAGYPSAMRFEDLALKSVIRRDD
jgi:hypothetical protein